MADHPSGPDDILPTYDRVGPTWAQGRAKSLFERNWLDRFRTSAPGPRILDLGCGTGDPIALYLAGCGCVVTGVDGAASLCALFAAALPGATVHHADMRGLSLGTRFDGILAWDSFFHLAPADQRAMFATFAAHAAPGAALMFTSGPAASEVWGHVAGAPVYHASLAPEEYRALLLANGFEVLAHVAEDPECDFHTIWLARATSA
ncbi:class I SAM-dependent methyltransferase [Tropicimonas sp. IMCC6043]|uniref:class I SAM-dependent methyltransferase n=1 Tax=Tropicimonas sp. IMCC6043 TaxID=2510645 RepID=UPI00101DFE92|nr:class I SAM-dependent methyltransferase [Tropicimonas sp. IMCC6043]RYH06959.1 class I SAM-dependent methyltransferase [Tropicimonas sp. IMCC6043]